MSQFQKSKVGSAAYTRRNITLRYDLEVMARIEAVAGPEAVARLSEPSPYHEVHRRVGDEIKVASCCCRAAGATAEECRIASGNKSRCACNCHSRRIFKAKPKPQE